MDLLLYQDDDGVAYSVHAKRDQWHEGTSVVRMTGFATIDDAYVRSIVSMLQVWPRMRIKAGVPDDADRSRNPIPLDALCLYDVERRL